MKRVAKFEKVSYEQFEKDYLDTFGLAGDDTSKRLRQEIESMYYGLELPIRATSGSAGYDIRTPFSFSLKPGEEIKIPTGLRCKMNDNYVLLVFPRSGLGFKYRETMSNTIPVVDSDYFYSDNEGHIFIKIVNCGNKEFCVKNNEAFVQGIFFEYGITDDDHVEATRNGVFGSTDKKE